MKEDIDHISHKLVSCVIDRSLLVANQWKKWGEHVPHTSLIKAEWHSVNAGKPSFPQAYQTHTATFGTESADWERESGKACLPNLCVCACVWIALSTLVQLECSSEVKWRGWHLSLFVHSLPMWRLPPRQAGAGEISVYWEELPVAATCSSDRISRKNTHSIKTEFQRVNIGPILAHLLFAVKCRTDEWASRKQFYLNCNWGALFVLPCQFPLQKKVQQTKRIRNEGKNRQRKAETCKSTSVQWFSCDSSENDSVQHFATTWFVQFWIVQNYFEQYTE